MKELMGKIPYPRPPGPSIFDKVRDRMAAERLLTKFFDYEHLPPHLQDVSKPFNELAHLIVDLCPAGPERTLALRQLWESKNLAVMAVIVSDDHE